MPLVTAFRRLLTVTGGLASLLLLAPAPASAQTGANVLVVANGASEGSVRIAEHYAKVEASPGLAAASDWLAWRQTHPTTSTARHSSA